MSVPIVQKCPRPDIPQDNNKITRTSLRKRLIKSSSFNRLKRVPSSVHAYFCRHGSTEILKWIHNSRTKLSVAIKELLPQLHAALLITSICAAVALLFFQLVICVFALILIGIPFGLLFLCLCIIIMTAVAISINISHMTHKLESEGQLHRSKDE